MRLIENISPSANFSMNNGQLALSISVHTFNNAAYSFDSAYLRGLL